MNALPEMSSNRYTWVDFYQNFATNLLTYKNDRKLLIEKLFTIFSDIGIKISEIENNGTIIDIDPFSVFGMFNNGLKEKNSERFIKMLADEEVNVDWYIINNSPTTALSYTIDQVYISN